MRNHPANKVRRTTETYRTKCIGCLAEGKPCPVHKDRAGFGGAILEALEHGIESWSFLERPDICTLGTHYKVTTLKSGAERRYELAGFTHYPTDGGDPRRFYVLSGGVGSARTILDASGEPFAHAKRKGRGFSREFREWIARTVASDLERCQF